MATVNNMNKPASVEASKEIPLLSETSTSPSSCPMPERDNSTSNDNNNVGAPIRRKAAAGVETQVGAAASAEHNNVSAPIQRNPFGESVAPVMRKKTAAARATCDTRKYLIAAIFMWMWHTWTIAISQHAATQQPPSDAFLRRGEGSNNKGIGGDQFSLAKDQSDGFFNDIPNTHWQTLQKYHVALFPNYYDDLFKFSSGPGDKGKIDKLRNCNMWYGRNFQVEFVCPLMRRLPSDSMADGPKWVCNPHRIAQQKDCLIYSVGSNGKAEFEKAIIEEIGDHCEVHTFDPVTHNKRNGDFATALKPYSKFHAWGFATEEQAKEKPSKFKTLRQTIEELGHVNRTIDVFKIDCEWCEWFTWQEWLTVDMRQILVETHNAPMPNARDMFFSLHDKGFVIFSKEANYENGAGGVEYAFVKVSTDFFLNNTMYMYQKTS